MVTLASLFFQFLVVSCLYAQNFSPVVTPVCSHKLLSIEISMTCSCGVVSVWGPLVLTQGLCAALRFASKAEYIADSLLAHRYVPLLKICLLLEVEVNSRKCESTLWAPGSVRLVFEKNN